LLILIVLFVLVDLVFFWGFFFSLFLA